MNEEVRSPLFPQPGEDQLSYHRRLIYGKLVDHTLADVDYSILAPLVYGVEYSDDHARKMFKGSLRTLELMDDSDVFSSLRSGDEATMTELEEKRLAFEKEKKKFSDQRREFYKLVTEDARFERMTEKIAEAAKNLKDEVPLHPAPAYKPVNDDECILVFNDWHYGMVTDNIWNTYNTAICVDRVNYVVTQAIRRLKLHKPGTLHLVLLGDLAHGAIHTSARVASEELVCEQLMHVAEIVAQASATLADYVGTVIIHSTYGNHMRTVQNKRDNIHADNMERLIPWWLEWRLSEYENIVVDNDTEHEFVLFECCGKHVLGTHGDLDSVKRAPRLLGSVFSRKKDIKIDYILLGDKHHLEEFEELGIESILMRSLCGTDDYANDHRMYSSAGQTMLFFNNSCGRDASYNFKIED